MSQSVPGVLEVPTPALVLALWMGHGVCVRTRGLRMGTGGQEVAWISPTARLSYI